MNNFKGLSLEPTDALKNISTILEGGYLLVICSDKQFQKLAIWSSILHVSTQPLRVLIRWRIRNERIRRFTP